jgi:hypothetical protein
VSAPSSPARSGPTRIGPPCPVPPRPKTSCSARARSIIARTRPGASRRSPGMSAASGRFAPGSAAASPRAIATGLGRAGLNTWRSTCARAPPRRRARSPGAATPRPGRASGPSSAPRRGGQDRPAIPAKRRTKTAPRAPARRARGSNHATCAALGRVRPRGSARTRAACALAVAPPGPLDERAHVGVVRHGEQCALAVRQSATAAVEAVPAIGRAMAGHALEQARKARGTRDPAPRHRDRAALALARRATLASASAKRLLRVAATRHATRPARPRRRAGTSRARATGGGAVETALAHRAPAAHASRIGLTHRTAVRAAEPTTESRPAGNAATRDAPDPGPRRSRAACAC